MTQFPTIAIGDAERDGYIRETLRQDGVLRDLLVLLYKATERADTPFWDACRALDPPEGLKEKLAIFRSSGRVFREHNELFTETSWLAALVGQGIEPGGYHPAADLLPDEETLRRLAHIRRIVAEKIGRANV